MSINWFPSEETEINIHPEDLPNFKLSKDIDEEAKGEQQLPAKEVAKNFVVDLQRALNEKRVDDLFYLYDRKFNRLSEAYFKNTQWPGVQEIEEQYEDLEVDLNTNYFYTELCFRHAYARLAASSITVDIRLKSYRNYLEIFETILRGKEDIALPHQWCWDILDEFFYQYQAFCIFRARMKDADDSNYTTLLQESGEIPTLEKVKWIFTSLIEKSKVLKAGKNQLEDFGPNTKINHIFGYYSIISLLRLHVISCDYAGALKVVEPIEFKRMNLFTKAFPCLNTLFYFAGFCYLMTKRYKESVKIFEAILSSYIKYKQFFSKSFQADAMNKQADKMLNLLAISLKFYQAPLDENVTSLLKEKVGDKLEKLAKYDTNTFSDCFTYGCPKLIPHIQNRDHFRSYGFERSTTETLTQQKDLLLAEFQKIQQLNNLDGVLRLYSSIKLDKLAKVMKITPDQLKDLIALYVERNNINVKDNLFEQTIVKKFIEAVPKIDLVIENDVIKINETVSKANFSKIFIKNITKLEEMMQEIQTL